MQGSTLADVTLRRVTGLQRGRLEMEALDQRHLGDREHHRQRNHTECLEADPEIGALRTPDDFVGSPSQRKSWT